MRLRFLYGEDRIEDVKTILDDCRQAKQGGRVLQYSVNNVSVRKAQYTDDINEIIYACEIFLRTWDPVISANNPIMRRVKPILYI